MKKIKIFKKYLGRFSEILIFLFILAVFVFSAYKILTITKIVNPIAYGATCDSYDCSWCDWDCSWCWPCPEPTPTSEPSPPPSEPTPTTPPSAGGPGEPGPPAPPGPPVCGVPAPPAPILLSVTPSGAGQADLSWTAVTPVTHYSISYGLSSGNYIYGVDNTGNVTFFSVGGLDPARDYCFAVRAVNDCAPSELSNEICTGVGAGQVLGVTTLADTGSWVDDLYWLLVIISSVCVGLGIRFLPVEKSV